MNDFPKKQLCVQNTVRQVNRAFHRLKKAVGFEPSPEPKPLKIVALIAAYNEERYIVPALRHLGEQGLEAVLFDNDSTDRCRKFAEPFLKKNLRSIERIPRSEGFNWAEILRKKAEYQNHADADWFLHLDPDEFRYPPPGYATLRDWITSADRQGYNAANFQEFTFLPCRETPDHDHPDFQKTMQYYYPFQVNMLHRVNAWKRQEQGVDLETMGGHEVLFPGRSITPETGLMRHYLFLSADHAREKYGQRGYDASERAKGWHGWRGDIETKTEISLPSLYEMNVLSGDGVFSFEKARTEHYPFCSSTT